MCATIVIGCNGKAQTKDKELVWLDDINSKSILENAECKNKVVPSEAENIDSFIAKLKKNFNSGFQRVILMFYVEGGEVIDFYSIAILLNGKEAELALYKDDLKQTKTLYDFDIKGFYKELSLIEEEEKIVSRELLLIDFEKKDIQCSFFENIKKVKGQRIKKLDF